MVHDEFACDRLNLIGNNEQTKQWTVSLDKLYSNNGYSLYELGLKERYFDFSILLLGVYLISLGWCAPKLIRYCLWADVVIEILLPGLCATK